MSLRRDLLLVPFLVALAACSCEDEVKAASGIFEMDPRSLDWGTACKDETAERSLVLRNAGNATLGITKVELKSANGVFSLLEDLPGEIEGGQSVIVRLGFTPPADTEYTGQLIVTTDSDDPDKAKQTAVLLGKGFRGKKLDLRVQCRCKSVDDPTSSTGSSTVCGTTDGDPQECKFLTFLHVAGGTTADATVELSNAGCGLLQVNEGVISQYGFEPDEAGMFQFLSPASFRLSGGEKKSVGIRFSAPPRESLPSPILTFRTNDPESKNTSENWAPGEWKVFLQADSVLPALSVTPDILTYFDAIDGQPSTRDITIANTGTASLKVDSVTLVPRDGTTDFAITLPSGETSFTLGPSGTGTDTRVVVATYTPHGSGSDRAEVQVKAGQLTGNVALVGGAEPQMEVVWLDAGTERAPPIDFGTVATGAKGETRTLRLRNKGRATLHLTSVTIPDEDNPGRGFKLGAGAPTSLAPAQQADVTITFDDAVTLRDDRAKLVIVSDDPSDVVNAGAHSADLLSTNAPNFAPVVSIVACNGAQVGKECSLDGSESTGPEAGDTLTYKWSIARKPAGSSAAVADAAAATTKFTPDVIGNYVITLTVTDQFGSRNPALSQSLNVQH